MAGVRKIVGIMPLGKQVNRVKGWFEGSSDDLLAKHRTSLLGWADKAAAALVATAKTATVRGEAWVTREDLAENLTAARDGLHDALSARARDRGLGRDWPDVFFRKGPHREASEPSTATPPGTPGSPA